MSSKIEVVLQHGDEAVHSFRLDRLTCADLAVAEVQRQASDATSGRPIRFVGYRNGDLRRLTEHTWTDAMRFLVPTEAGAAGALDRLTLCVLLEEEALESGAEGAAEEAAPAGRWEVQTDAGWKRFRPSSRFNGVAGEEIVFWMQERKYRASFTTAFEGIQVNLSTLRSRPLKKVVGSVAESQDWFDDGPEDGAYKIVLKGGDNPKSTFEQLGWELCAHRVQATDKRDSTSTYLMLSKPSDGKTGAGRSCNHFELTRVGTRYRIAMRGGDGTNTYEQVGWQLSGLRTVGTDTRNADSTYASIVKAPDVSQGYLFELKRFGASYKITLAAGEGGQSGWELCAHRALARDQRSKTTTYVTLHRSAEGRTCNHFVLQRIGGPPASSGIGAQIYGLDGELWGLVAGDEGGAWRLDGGRVAKKATEGSKWRWGISEDVEPALPAPAPAAPPLATPASVEVVAAYEESSSPAGFEVVGHEDAVEFFDVCMPQPAADAEAAAGFKVVDPSTVEACEVHLELGANSSPAIPAAAAGSAAGDEDEWAIVDK